MLWAATEYIGCGYSTCTTEPDGNGNPWYKKYAVCNYGEAGNMAGEPAFSLEAFNRINNDMVHQEEFGLPVPSC